MSDAIEAAAKALCLATGLDWDAIPDAAEGDNEDTGPETKRYFRQWVRPAITAYEAAKGGGVDPSFPTALSDSEVRIWINSCNHEPARQALRQLLAYRVRGVSSALTSPASGSAQPRSFWMHYDHQVGRWIVDDRPPSAVRTGSEVIHVLEVLPTSPASGDEYRPTILHLGVEAGDPHWQFVERDVPTVTGQVFAANVEKLTDFDGNLVGFNIFEPSPASGERDATTASAESDE